MEAILIKVAGIGLTTKHLGKTLAQMQPTLTKLVSSKPFFALSTNHAESARTRYMGPISAVKVANMRL